MPAPQVVVGLLIVTAAIWSARSVQTKAAEAANEDVAALQSLVYEVRLENETISPITARFIQRTIERAEAERAQCLVIVLDTPGGLVDSTRAIVNSILRSRTPVVVYVSPRGARAASAGVFIALSSHVAAMAPTTTIGAAHPVTIGGLPASPDPDSETAERDQDGRGEDKTDKIVRPTAEDDAKEEADEPAERTRRRRTPQEEKIVSSTVAWARSLAELRGRNARWAEKAVEESITATEKEALKEGVIELIADDLDDLLQKLDGRKVELAHETVTLQTAQAEVRTLQMWWGESLLAKISNPNIAFLLLMLGFYAILFELYSPGWGVAGIIGIIALVLAFMGLAILPINYIGLLLIFIALGLFAAEVFVTSYGALTAAGILSLVMGALMLVDSPRGFARVSLAAVIPVAVATAAITLFLVGTAVRAHRKRVQTGVESLAGAPAVALEEFASVGNQYQGTVRVQGEIWQAVSDAPVCTGQKMQVRGREGLTLFVEPAGERTAATAEGGSKG